MRISTTSYFYRDRNKTRDSVRIRCLISLAYAVHEPVSYDERSNLRSTSSSMLRLGRILIMTEGLGETEHFQDTEQPVTSNSRGINKARLIVKFVGATGTGSKVLLQLHLA